MFAPLKIQIQQWPDAEIKVQELYHLNDIELTSFPVVYELDIEDFKGDELKFLPLLNNKERQRYIQYLKKKDAKRFLIARAALRILLANYCEVYPEDIEIEIGADKKPFLVHPSSDIQFNVSHTDSKIVIALDKYSVGVDIENNSNVAKVSLLGDRLLSSKEQLSIADSADARSQFCLYWTRKEAFLKAIGKGIDDTIIGIPAMNGEHCLWNQISDFKNDWAVYSFNRDNQHICSLAFNNSEEPGYPKLCKLKQEALLMYL